jgi:hypothetical protein
VVRKAALALRQGGAALAAAAIPVQAVHQRHRLMWRVPRLGFRIIHLIQISISYLRTRWKVRLPHQVQVALSQAVVAALHPAISFSQSQQGRCP